MAHFSMRVQVIQRSKGHSVMAAAAYRAGEKLRDERQGMIHDYSRRTGVERTEILLPANPPAWLRGIGREALWNAVDARERQKNSQTARELRLMIPRELPDKDRITLVRDFVLRAFVSKGMIADVCWHNKTASDGGENCHAHVMLTMRPVTEDGFGLKSRHEFVPDPEGKKHANGRPVMVESNPDSWNSAIYYEKECRERWENLANATLERIGSAERIDRRSLIERNLARLPQPALRLAFHLKELRGVMRERFQQFTYAKHYQAVEDRAKGAFRLDIDPVAELKAGAEARAAAPRRIEPPAQRWQRFYDWIDRQITRLAIAPPAPELGQPRQAERSVATRSPPTPDMER